MKKDEGEAALRSDQGVEIKCHDASFSRKYNTADDKVATELEKFENVRGRTEYGMGTENTTKDRDTWPGEKQVFIQPLTRLQRMTKVPVCYKDYMMT